MRSRGVGVVIGRGGRRALVGARAERQLLESKGARCHAARLDDELLIGAFAGVAVLAVAGWTVALVMWRRALRRAFEVEALERRAREAEAFEARSRETFEALAGRALRQSGEQFLALAKERLGAQEGRSARELDRRKDAVDRLVEPIGKALERTRAELEALRRANAGLRAQVEGVTKANIALSKETGRLSNALRRPNVRGRYGEIQLQRVVELAGMRPYCDFGTQVTTTDENGQVLKPDLVVRMPNDRTIVVDAKTSLDAYLDAVESEDKGRAQEHRERFARAVSEQLDRLSRKEYWAQFEGSPEFVVMFVPGDQFIDMALRERPELLEAAAERNVILASPSTLIGLLRAVHVGWREKRLEDSARELFALGRELHERSANVMNHAGALGKALRGSVESYNAFVGSMEERMVPTLRRFEERGAASAKVLTPLPPVDTPVRKRKKRRKRSSDGTR